MSVKPEFARQGGPTVPLKDIQRQGDDREIPIEKVGVSGLRHPITVMDRAAEIQRTIATLGLSVGLPQDTKGTHMSRYYAVFPTTSLSSLTSMKLGSNWYLRLCFP